MTEVIPSNVEGFIPNGSTESFDKLRTPLTTRYYYDGDELILEKSGATVLYYIHGPRIDEIISDSGDTATTATA